MVGFTAFRYRIATRPLPVKGTHIEFREGLLLRSTVSPDFWSDASPLPGFSTETIDDVISSLDSSAANIPSLDFAKDSLSNNLPLAGEVPVCALLAEKDAETFAHQAKLLGNSPFRAVKLKVGRLSIENDISRVRVLREKLRHEQTIRLDANRSWNLQDAIRFAKGISDVEIEFIEEPVADPTDLEPFHANTACRYALDESLADPFFSLQNFPNVSAFVVKPTILGGTARMERLIATGKPMILSSVFESGVGLYHIGRIALQYSQNRTVGLDTYRWLKDDILVNRWNLDDGYFRFSAPPQVDMNRLTPVL